MFMQKNTLSNVNPIYCKGDLTICDNNWHYDNILIGYVRLYYIIEGECIIEVDGIRHIAKPGQMFFLPCNSTQKLYTEKNKTVKKYWVHCTLPCGEYDFSELINLPYFIEVKDRQTIESLFQNIIAYKSDISLTDKLNQKADILRLLAYYIQHEDNSRIDIEFDTQISYIIDYIDNNLSENLSLENLSSMVHFHPSYFVRYFKAATRLTPMSYINNRRIRLAQKLLLGEKIPIQDIASKVGFKSPHYFCRCFKQKTGFTPTEYRYTAIQTYKVK